MEVEFWLHKWAENKIGFHMQEVNPLIKKHFSALKLEKGACVLVPLCGKTLDISWLLSQGYHVVGAELSELAIRQLFQQLKIQPNIEQVDNFTHYYFENLDIFVGNIFHITREMIGVIDGIYDRAALVALPKAMRKQYTKHLSYLTDAAPQLLITFDYDQELLDGPPFSVPASEVEEHYATIYQIDNLESNFLKGWLRNIADTTENVWLLHHAE